MLLAAWLAGAVSLSATIPVFNAVGDMIVLESDSLYADRSESDGSVALDARWEYFELVGSARLRLDLRTTSGIYLLANGFDSLRVLSGNK